MTSVKYYIQNLNITGLDPRAIFALAKWTMSRLSVHSMQKVSGGLYCNISLRITDTGITTTLKLPALRPALPLILPADSWPPAMVQNVPKSMFTTECSHLTPATPTEDFSLIPTSYLLLVLATFPKLHLLYMYLFMLRKSLKKHKKVA